MKEGNEVRRVVAVVPGIASFAPEGIEEGEAEIVAPLEVLHIFLPPSVVGTSALANYGIDPAKIELLRGQGVADPLFKEVALAFQRMLSRPPEPTDKLFVEGASSMLAAHLFSKYSNHSGQALPRAPSLPHEKLKRVLDLIECRFTEGIGLDEMAGEACLSTFHFARLFQRVTGLSPHRYVTERRIQEAKNKLSEGRLSLVEIALEAGFGSQNNFTRIFRKHTGMTPGEFRTRQRSRGGYPD